MMFLLNKSPIATRPESEEVVSNIAFNLLQKASAIGFLPTPVDEIIEAAEIVKVVSFQEFDEGFVSSLKKRAQDTIRSAFQKIRGIADLREKAIYVQNDSRPSRILFPKLHELGHQKIPWHSIDPTYLDDDSTLSLTVQESFEKEANFFASEIIFQGKEFRKRALDYAPSFEAVFKLASLHGASNQATIWRYVEEHDETLAVAQYYPINAFDEENKQVLGLWRIVASAKFSEKYADVELPPRIRSGCPWKQAVEYESVYQGKDNFVCGNGNISFEWHAWWNNYTLFVLLRRRPSLGIVGKILK